MFAERWDRRRADDRGAALVHLFRFERDRIAGLWDIGQEVLADRQQERDVLKCGGSYISMTKPELTGT